MCLVLGLYILISLVVGLPEIGLFIQPFLNIGLGYFVARQRNCNYRWADVMQIIMATGTVLVISVMLSLAMPYTFGALLGLTNAVISVVYLPIKIFGIFPKGGRAGNPSLVEDIKNIIDERSKTL
ncbi:MAG: hypothetical protein DPW18_06050 [Chloroflexi bacterium]|nr:hypothetical protein [Chloroflexota bacterium]MDL1941835.1 hypothetical protein [Chloroflexi bacterium CFX2]